MTLASIGGEKQAGIRTPLKNCFYIQYIVAQNIQIYFILYYFAQNKDFFSGVVSVVGVKSPNYDAYGLFRALHSHNPGIIYKKTSSLIIRDEVYPRFHSFRDSVLWSYADTNLHFSYLTRIHVLHYQIPINPSPSQLPEALHRYSS